MIEVKNFDGDVSVGRNAVVGGDAKVCGGMTVGKNLKVEGWLDAKNIKGSNKGLFVDEASLKKAYPVPQDGWWALVGDTMPAALWVANGGEWVTNGGTGGEITVESQQIEALIERFEEEMQSMRDVNEAQTNNIVALSNATNTNAAEIEAVKSKNAEQDELLAASVAADAAHDEEISALKSKDTTHDSRIEKLEERVLQYIYPKLYQLNEGAGALKFNGFTEAEGSGGLLLTKDTYRYSVMYSTTQKAFILNVTDEVSGQGVRVGTFNIWPKIEGKGIASSESYAERDNLFYIYVAGEGSTYYYIDNEGIATEASATYLLRRLVDKNASAIAALQGKNAEQDERITAAQTKNDEQDTRINALLQEIPWEGYHMNAFTDTGEYHIHGESTDANDGLPILNSGTIDARLTVLDSSLTRGTGAKTDTVVTQILRLSNRMGGDGHVYVRTGQAATKSQLAIQNSTAWSTWEKLMGVFEKNAVSNATELDKYTSSGMYDGMFVFSPESQTTVSGLKIESGSTFLMVVVNGYAVGKSAVPQVTQLLYVMPSGLDGSSGVRNAKLYTRTGIYVATTNTYTWGNFDGLAQASDISKLNNRLDTAERTIASEQSRLDEVRHAAITDISVTGDAMGVKIITDNTIEPSGGDIKIPNADHRNNTAGVVTAEEINALYEIDFAAADVTNIGFEKDAEKNKITLTGIGQLGDSQSVGIELTPATSELAGLMSATDKIKLDSVESTATAAQTKNDGQDARLEKIENSVSHLSAAGRYWNEANGTPTAAGHYGSLDALRSLPEKLGLGRYLVKDDRTRRKLDPKDSTKYADDGTTAKLDGTDGQCMWCWNGFYANVWKEGDNLFKVVSFDRPVGNDISIWIPAGGISWLGAGVIDRGDAPFTDKTKWKLCSLISDDERYRGGGGTALDASKYSKAPADTTPQITMLGMPATNISTTNFGNYARKRGEGWEANWFVARFVVEFLFEVIMGTENSQAAFNAEKDANGLYQGGFGTGVTDMPDWNNYNGSYPLIPTSVGLEAGDGVRIIEYKLPQSKIAEGDTYKTFNVPVFFGLVGAGYGHLWQWVRGLIMDAGEEKSLVYVAPSMYAAYDPNTVAGKIMVAECPRVIGWITRKSYKGLCCMPTEIGGSSTLRYSDQFYTNANTYKGLRVRTAGGHAGNGTSAGASYTNASNAAAFAHANFSAPLCYFEEDPKIPDSQSIANNS